MLALHDLQTLQLVDDWALGHSKEKKKTLLMSHFGKTVPDVLVVTVHRAGLLNSAPRPSSSSGGNRRGVLLLLIPNTVILVPSRPLSSSLGPSLRATSHPGLPLPKSLVVFLGLSSSGFWFTRIHSTHTSTGK
jgi:hypothetical protein